MASLRTEILSMRLDGVLSLCVGSTQLNQVTDIEKDLKPYGHKDNFVASAVVYFASRLHTLTRTVVIRNGILKNRRCFKVNN